MSTKKSGSSIIIQMQRRNCKPLAKACKSLAAAALIILVVQVCRTALGAPAALDQSQQQQTKPPQSTSFNDLVTQTASMYIRNSQASACDGEILNIKCTEPDYLIDVITAELTILPAQAQRTSTHLHETSQHQRSSTRDTRVSESMPESKLSSLDSNQICKPTPMMVADDGGGATIKTATITPATTTTSTPPEAATTTGPATTTTTTQPTLATGTEKTAATAAHLATSVTNLQSTSGNAALCDEQQSKAASATINRAEFVSLVKTECQSFGSCSLDLRRPSSSLQSAARAPDASLVVPGEPGQLQNNISNLSSANLPKSNGIKLSQIVAGAGAGGSTNGQCSSNRKLLEVVYKCRPSRFSRRARCRGSWLRLDCPPGKRLYVVAGQYGSNTTDTKMHERCSAEQQKQQPGAATGNSAQPVALRKPAQQSRVCLADDTQHLVEKCSMKQRCDMLADNSVFGEPSCSSGLTEILSIIYTCANESLLKNDASTAHLWAEAYSLGDATLQQESQPSPKLMRQEPRYPATEAPVPSNMLMSATTNQLHFTAQLGTSPSNQLVLAGTGNEQPQRTTLEAPSGSSLFTGQTQLEYPTTSIEQQEYVRNSVSPSFTSTNYVTATLNDRASPTLNAFKGPSDQWDHSQRMKLFINRYKMHIVATGSVFLSIIVLAIAFSGCRRLVGGNRTKFGDRGSSSGSMRKSIVKDSTDSGSGKSSAGLKSLSCSTTSSTSAQVAAHMKHNSCSESCFSLQEDDFNTATTTTTTNGFTLNSESSPAGGAHTPLSMTGPDQQSIARPKLWTIHSGQQQHQQRNHAHHQTLRPTRTFLTNQQHLNQYLAHHQTPVAPPTCSGQAAGAAADLLLAMTTAANQRQQQQQHQMNAANWCNTFQQQQQFQQPLDFTTNTIQLELPQPAILGQQEMTSFHHQFESSLMQTQANNLPLSQSQSQSQNSNQTQMHQHMN